MGLPDLVVAVTKSEDDELVERGLDLMGDLAELEVPRISALVEAKAPFWVQAFLMRMAVDQFCAGPNEQEPTRNRFSRKAGRLACARAVTKLHGAFKVHFLCARREAGAFLNVSARISSPD